MGNQITGTNNGETLNGTSGFDEIFGLGGDDVLNGLGGSDFLTGGAGADALNGGEGYDSVFYSDAPTGVRADLSNSSLNTGEAAGDTYSSIDAIYGSRYDDYLGGDDGSNRILGNSASGVNVGGGNDTIFGYGGNDELYGDSGNDFIDGGTGREYIFGYGGNDTIVVDGSVANGADEIDGGTGDDVYRLSGLNFTLNDDGGVDRIEISVTVPFLDSQIENLTLTGTAAINGTGNDLENRIFGNNAANILDGYDGDDVLLGLGGNDTLVGGYSNYSPGDFGIDSLYGGFGDDIYVVAGLEDTLVEYADEGHDTVHSAVRWVLGADFEDLELDGFGAPNINGFGNALVNRLTGNYGSNYLSGGLEYDTLVGGGGDDRYGLDDLTFIDEQSGWMYDQVVEAANGGIDKVYVSYQGNNSYFLPDNIENGEVTGASGLQLVGNEFGNILTGNDAYNLFYGEDGADTLNGGGGFDELIGGAGNDIFVLASTTLINGGYTWDTVGEGAGGGIDTVYASADVGRYTYQLGADVENLVATGVSIFRLWGNELNNSLTGNGAANEMAGFTGDDVLIGGAGGDTHDGGEGTDTASYATASAGITAILGNNTFNGGDAVGDTFISIETVVGSNFADTIGVRGTSVSTISGLDGDDALYGSDSANPILGGAGNDTITGFDGNDRLDGGLGADTLDGGLGNDVYLLNDVSGAASPYAFDTVVEAAGKGIDTVRVASLDNNLGGGDKYILVAEVENGTVTGARNFSLTGNRLDNTLIGNGANNTLQGLDGNDRLNGGVGIDALIGGLGRDVMNGGDGNDRFDFNSIAETGVAKAARDVIAGFTHLIDDIDLRTIDAIAGGSNDPFVFRGVDAFTAAGQVRLVQSGADTIVQLNTVGTSGAEAAIQLAGIAATTLTDADFLL